MTILFLLSVGLNIFLCFCCYYLAKEYQTEHEINEAAKKGKWIVDDEWGNCHCSVCKFVNNRQPYYCEECGADMRSEQNFNYADNDTAQGGLASAT